MKIEDEGITSRIGKLTLNNHIVKVDENMRIRCWDFAEKIIGTGNQYDRMLPNHINNEEEKRLIRIQRTYVGKIAEYAFFEYLEEMGKDPEMGDMLIIYEGQENVDDYDFITKYNETVDVKAAFRKNHRNLVVNLDQLQRIQKDFYVGVKLNAKDYNGNLIQPNSITMAKICGYCDSKYLNRQPTINLGEANCKAVGLEKLLGIYRLLNRF